MFFDYSFFLNFKTIWEKHDLEYTIAQVLESVNLSFSECIQLLSLPDKNALVIVIKLAQV